MGLPDLEHFIIKNELNKLECYVTVDRKGLPGRNTGLFDPFKRYQGRKFCECCKHFIFLVTTEYTYKLECYITLGRKGLPGVNTLAYLVHS